MKWFIGILAFLAAVGAGVYWFTLQLREEVPVAEAMTGTSFDVVTGTVKVYANLDVKVKSERPGLITDVAVELGQVVEEDEVLVVQDSTELRIELEQARIRMDAAAARKAVPNPITFDLETLETEVTGTRLAVELSEATPVELERTEREVSKQEARLQRENISEQENVDFWTEQYRQLRYQILRMTTRAPFDGKVVEILKFKGDRVHGNQELMRLVSHGRWVEMTLSEEDVFGVSAGQRVVVRLASYPNREFEGEVTGLAYFADSDEKTRKVFVRLAAEDELLVPGLTGEGIVYRGQRENAVLIPRRALYGDRVYVVSEGRVEIRRVKPGFRGLHRAEVLEGLEEGELVVLEGQAAMRDGQLIVPLRNP